MREELRLKLESLLQNGSDFDIYLLHEFVSGMLEASEEQANSHNEQVKL